MEKRSGEAATLNNIGMVYSALGQKRKALEYYENALPILREVGDRSVEATTINNIGGVYDALGQKQKALEYLEKVIPIFHELGDNASEAVLLGNLMGTWHDMNKNSLAIFYGKQAVNTLQNLRKNIDKLDIKTKLKYLISFGDLYRISAFLMIYSGRIAEAQQVLDILKDEEYFSFVWKDRSAYTPQYSPIDYTGFERKWINRQYTIVEKISSISRPYHELFIKTNKTQEEETKLEALKRELEMAQEVYKDFLDQLKKDFETYENQKYPDIEALTKQSSALMEFLKTLDREKGCSGLIKGNALIDNDFTRETMINRLKTTSYPFVHIASHFKFSPGNETNNQLLLGDGTTMSLSDIRKVKEGKLFDGVKLLVLSACQTGMGGNGEEIDGFGELAQQCGAGSVIASLWSVDDESTKELMVKFYSILEEGKVTSKIEALRLAQLQLAGLEDLIDKSKATTYAASGKKSAYSQPYYWAPFIMMGDWR